MFPSPLGVLGLIREIHCALFKVSVPSRGFGSDDTWGEGMAMMVDEVSVPSRGFGSDDTGRGALTATAHMFPSPLGVLGLTTSDSISPGGQQISHVSVPSRGFGSDDSMNDARQR
ncbi:hypothetical protein AN79_02950 [Mycobacterium tuberculosis M1309]|nr:hypothetical protein AN79_02950 [Mycobacterium tuberculosis M1309]